MEFENEVWKDIERYNGRYQIKCKLIEKGMRLT